MVETIGFLFVYNAGFFGWRLYRKFDPIAFIFTLVFLIYACMIVAAVLWTIWILKYVVLTIVVVVYLVKILKASYKRRHVVNRCPPEFLYKRTTPK